nr:hypothetical protein [Ralstonia solanacearum]
MRQAAPDYFPEGSLENLITLGGDYGRLGLMPAAQPFKQKDRQASGLFFVQPEEQSVHHTGRFSVVLTQAIPHYEVQNGLDVFIAVQEHKVLEYRWPSFDDEHANDFVYEGLRWVRPRKVQRHFVVLLQQRNDFISDR